MTKRSYKVLRDSEVGWLGHVPSHWEIKRLRFVASLNPPKSEAAELGPLTEVTFLPMEAIGEDGSLNLKRTRPVGEVQTGYTYFADGDITIAKITPCFENGKGAIMRGLSGGIGFGTTELIVVRPKSAHPDFLHWLFVSTSFRQLGEGAMYGAGGQKRVPDDFVRDFTTAWPPLPEQRIIAAFLDRETGKIDALVEEQTRLLELLKEKRRTVISRAVTKGLDANAPMKDSGVEWLGEVPAHWDVRQLGHLTQPGTTVTYGIVQAGPDIEGGIPYIRTSDMSGETLPREGYLRTSAEIDAAYARSKVRVGDLVIAIRATIGKPLLVPDYLDGANLTQGTAKFSPDETITALFVHYFLCSSGANQEFQRLAKGATFKELTLEMLRKIRVARPPLVEQKLIVEFVDNETSRLDALIANVKNSAALLQERRSALISAAVTGKIDVRGLVPEEAAAA